MNKLTKYCFQAFAALALVFSLNSCETTELEILESPNALTPESSDLDYYLNAMQLDMVSFFNSVTDQGQELTRMLHMFGPFYENAYTTTNMNGMWNDAYSDIFTDYNNLVPKALEKGWETHVGIAKVIKAYTMITLVDFIGDVPYTEAAQGVENLNPSTDSGADVYNAALALINEARDHFAVESQSPSNDLIYGGDRAKWTRFTNTLEFKLRLQRRNAAEGDDAARINALIASAGDDLIVAKAHDFQVNYGTLNANPDSRHPRFVSNYDLPADVADYMSNTYMNEFVGKKNVADIRAAYYFYRQDDDVTDNDDNEIPCGNERRPSHYGPDEIFCYIGYNDIDPGSSSSAGYWGRDHGDNDGIPPDGGLRTAYGIYPFGGRFDDGAAIAVAGREEGLRGAGMSPVMLSAYTHFMIAEWHMANGNEADARAFLQSGIEQSFEKVTTFAADQGNAGAVNFRGATGAAQLSTWNDGIASSISAYVEEVCGSGNAASLWATSSDKMGLIINEYRLALFGNGVEAYNTFRRTDKPEGLQPLLKSSNNDFITSFFYPRTEVDNNNNISQKADHTQRVFWDN